MNENHLYIGIPVVLGIALLNAYFTKKRGWTETFSYGLLLIHIGAIGLALNVLFGIPLVGLSAGEGFMTTAGVRDNTKPVAFLLIGLGSAVVAYDWLVKRK